MTSNPKAAPRGSDARPGRQAPGQRFGQYELLEKLGSGAIGDTFAAVDARGQEVCLKIMLPRYQLPGRSGYADRDLVIDSLRHEARAVERFDHPNIAAMLDYGSVRDVWFIAFELVKGANLWEVLGARGNTMAPEHVQAIGIQVAEALQCAHEHDVLHRDVKPGNILISDSGQVKLVDFGLAKLQASQAEDWSRHVGTPRYWAPEQVRGEAVTPQTDIYALGLVLVELVTGEHPAPFDEAAEFPESIAFGRRGVDLASLPIPEFLRDILARCLHPDPKERFESAGELAAVLRAGDPRHPASQLGALAGDRAQLRRKAARFAAFCADKPSNVPPRMAAEDPFEAPTHVAAAEDMVERAVDGVPRSDSQHREVLGDLARMAVAAMGDRAQASTVHADSGRRLRQSADATWQPDETQAPAPLTVDPGNLPSSQHDEQRTQTPTTERSGAVAFVAAAAAVGLLAAAGGAWLLRDGGDATAQVETATSAATAPSAASAESPPQEAAAEPPSAVVADAPSTDAVDRDATAAPEQDENSSPELPSVKTAPVAAQSKKRNASAQPRTSAKKALVPVRVGLIPGGEVFVDGKRVGRSPATVKLWPGKHEITGALGSFRAGHTIHVTQGMDPVVIDLRDAKP